MTERVEVFPLQGTSTCKRCKEFLNHPEFDHTLCRRHRSCTQKEGYAPASCAVCVSNRNKWSADPNSSRLPDWKDILRKTQKNRDKPWSYELATPFFTGNLSEIRNPSTPELSQLPNAPSTSRAQIVPDVQYLSVDNPVITLQDVPIHLPLYDPGPSTSRGISHENIASQQPSVVNENSPDPDKWQQILSFMDKFSSQLADMKSSHSNLQDQFCEFKSRKSRHSRSYSRSHSRSSSGSSDSSRSSYSSRSRSPSPTWKKDPLTLKFCDLKLFKRQGNSAYFMLEPHMKIDGGRLWLDDEWARISRHPTENAFKFSEASDDDKSFLVPNAQAVESAKTIYRRDIVPSLKAGDSSKVLKVTPEGQSFFLELLKPLKEKQEFLADAIIKGDNVFLSQVFQDYRPGLNLVFDNAWPLSADYSAWAKPEVVNLRETSSQLCLPSTVNCPEKFLKKERDLRSVVVDSLSSCFGLASTAKRQEKTNCINEMRMSLLILKGFLPSLKSVIIQWMKAKIDVRRIVLQDSKTTYAARLLASSVWHHHLFEMSVVQDILKSPDVVRHGLHSLLSWTDARNKEIKARPNAVDPNIAGLFKPQPSFSSATASSSQGKRSRSRKRRRSFSRSKERPFRGERKGPSNKNTGKAYKGKSVTSKSKK